MAGSTIAAITREKAGILRRGGTMITLPQHPEANQVLGEVADGTGCARWSARFPIVPARRYAGAPIRSRLWERRFKVDSPLAGAHQQRNVALAIAAAVELGEPRISYYARRALKRGFASTQWPGRLERMANSGCGMDSGCRAQSGRRVGAARRAARHFGSAQTREC